MEKDKTIKEYILPDGRKVLLRTPKPSDLAGLLELINSLVEEKAQIMISQKVTGEQERRFLHVTGEKIRQEQRICGRNHHGKANRLVSAGTLLLFKLSPAPYIKQHG